MTKWARWHWTDGVVGRWHAVVGPLHDEHGQPVPDVWRLACGRRRLAVAAEVTEAPEGKVCRACRGLDDLRRSLTEDFAVAPVTVGNLLTP